MNIKKFLAVILVTIIAITVFAGCDVITKNEERDYNQSLATVKYAGLTSTVTKGEFNESFNSLAYYYVYYYGYTVDEAATSILDSLAQRKLLILYVRDEIAKKQGVANTTAVADLLNAVEKNEAVKSANESMAKWYKQVFEELWKEANSTDDTTDDKKDDDKVDETDKIAARPTRPDKAEAEVDYDAELKPEDAEIKFFEKAKKDLFTAKEWEELNKVEGKVDYVDKALNELKNNLQTTTSPTIITLTARTKPSLSRSIRENSSRISTPTTPQLRLNTTDTFRSTRKNSASKRKRITSRQSRRP